MTETEIQELTKSGLTTEEAEILSMTKDIWQKYSNLNKLHESHTKDFADAVHTIQRLIWMRPTYSKYLKK